MANDPRIPMVGEVALDATDIIDILIDLAEGARVGMRTEQEGCDRAEAEVDGNQPTYGERAGITQLTVQELRKSRDAIDKIKKKLHAVRKLKEILEESLAFHDDRRQRLLHGIADSVERQAKARGDHELLAKYEQTRAYRSSIARKAVRTRRRNQQEEIEQPESKPAE